MTKKTTKRSLALSILSMALCAAILIGSTYAWFSDSVKTAATTITAGNLDVDIVDEEGGSLQDQPLFKIPDDFLWEPGAMFVSENFKIKNNGTVALWYSLTVNAENKGDVNLLDVVKMKVVKADGLTLPEAGADQAARKAYWDSITSDKEATTGTLEAVDGSNETENLVAVLYWEPTNSTELDNKDNNYNKPGETLKAEFFVNVFATQVSSESDSFGKDYDASAKGGEFYAAMEDAVEEAAEALKEANVNISFTVNEEGNPELDVTPTKDENGNVNLAGLTASYEAVKSAIADALATQEDAIISLSIGGYVPYSFSEEDLEKALGQYLDSVVAGDLNALATYLSENDYKILIPVTVTDTLGAVVEYEVVINAETYQEAIESLIG